MTVLEKIKRCVSLVWGFQEYCGEEDIEDFCSNELRTYPQYDEIMEYFKQNEALEKDNAKLRKACDETQELLDKQIEATLKLDKEKQDLRDNYDLFKAIAEPEIERLENENIKLRKIVKMVAMINKGVYSEEGIKAIYAEAEQFLKDSEVEDDKETKSVL